MNKYLKCFPMYLYLNTFIFKSVCLVTGGQRAWTWNSPGTWLPLLPGAGCSIRGLSGGRMTSKIMTSCVKDTETVVRPSRQRQRLLIMPFMGWSGLPLWVDFDWDWVSSFIRKWNAPTCWRRADLLAPRRPAGAAPTCWRRADLLAPRRPAGAAPTCWRRADLLAPRRPAGAAPTCWRRADLLAPRRPAGAAPTCWRRADLLAPRRPAGAAPTCWRRAP